MHRVGKRRTQVSRGEAERAPGLGGVEDVRMLGGPQHLDPVVSAARP
ncbi:hypothetical protein J7F02_03335 [Streptomyces sp. ISL-112]|nr:MULTISPECIES: hypothetical protein [unclassified Streptomyces]MBT2424754.1 hypothetical protein [Streptomyces sp. ISL-112]MBT2465985.1 hypothetical protein [Streptomyces sp. ISL-63]